MDRRGPAVKLHLKHRNEAMLLDADYRQQRMRRQLVTLLWGLFLDVVALVAVCAAGAVAAVYWVEFNPGFRFDAWCAFTGLCSGVAYLFGTSWGRIKDWMF